MSDHLVLCVDHLPSPDSFHLVQGTEAPVPYGEGSSSHTVDPPSCVINVKGVGEHSVAEEEEPLIQTVECRICQEEDSIKNLEVPCACSGSLKYAHRKCVQRWCNEKGDITCEICHQSYQPGYAAPPPPPQSDDTTVNIRQTLEFLVPVSLLTLLWGEKESCMDGEAWTVSGAPLDFLDPRILAVAAAEHHVLESEYDEYADTNASGATFCRSAALILMALLLLRHALTLTNSDGEDDASTFFSLFMLRAAGFLLPCYIMAWAVSILQRRRQRQEAAALEATEFAFMLQAGQRRRLHFTIAPVPAVTPHQESLQ